MTFSSQFSGKTSLVIQFIENQYYENYCPTIENTYSKSIKYNGVEYDVDILDTAGQVCSYVVMVFLILLTPSPSRMNIL